MEKTPQPGEIYQHFKGNLYRIVTLAEHTENGEQLVIYQALYGEFKTYARPLSMFLGEVDHGKYPEEKGKARFTLVPMAGEILPENQAAAYANRTEEAYVSPGGRQGNCESAAPVPEAAKQEEAFQLDPGLLAFLEADSYERKLEIYASLAGKADESMLNTIAVSLDLELSGDSLEEQYETLKNCLLMLEKYECNRLR